MGLGKAVQPRPELLVALYGYDLPRACGQALGEVTDSGADFQDRILGANPGVVDLAFQNAPLHQEALPQLGLRPDVAQQVSHGRSAPLRTGAGSSTSWCSCRAGAREPRR